MLSMLGKNFSIWYFEIFSFFFLEKSIWHFMQIGDNLHEMSKTFSGKKFPGKNKKNMTNLLSAGYA